MTRTVASAFAAFAVLAVIPPAFAKAPAGEQAKGGPVVRIDFRALTDDGQQVADLKRDDVVLRVNGKPRQIQSLTFVGGNTGPATGGSMLPPPFSTNTVGSAGRIIYMLVDDDSISPGREGQVKEAVRLLIAELAPDDEIGVLTTQGQVNMRPGADPTKVRLAVDEIAGKGPATETDADAACRTKRALAAIGTMLTLTGGRPTTIVIFSAGMTGPTVTMTQIGRTSDTAACPIRAEDFQELGAVAATAHADLYLFQITEGRATRSSSQDAGFESVAGVTGAEFIRVTASPQAAVARLLRETSAYYVASFEPDASERNGQTYRVEMRSTRDRVKLRTRPSVDMPKGDVKKSASAASPKEMLRVAAEYQDLPLRAAAYTSRTPGSDDVTIITLFEGIDPGTTLKEASVGLFDEKNTLKKQWSAQGGELGKRPVMAALSAPPGGYRLRVAAVDGSGRAGTTDYEFFADVPRADPLRLSALVLGTQQGGTFIPRLQFTDEPIAIGQLEIYGVPKGGAVTVNLDVSSTPDGSPLATAETTVRPGRAEDSRIAFGGFSIASLAPGDYQMRAIVNLDGKAVGKVVRTLRKAP